MSSEILTSIHGRRLGLDHQGRLIVNGKIFWDGQPAIGDGEFIFVSSVTGNAAFEGRVPEKPVTTVDLALEQVTANKNYTIILLPGHVEDFDDTTTGWDLDVGGVNMIGVGYGNLRPRFDFNHATSKCVIGNESCYLRGIDFRPSVATVAIGLDLEDGVKANILEDLRFLVGEDGAGTDEFVNAIHLTNANHYTEFYGNGIFCNNSCNGALYGIRMDDACDYLVFKDNIVDGPFAAYGIGVDSSGKDYIAINNSSNVSGTPFNFASTTFAKRTGNMANGTLEDAAENLIGFNDSDNNADTSNVVANRDGSVLERLEFIQARQSLLESTGEADIDIDQADYTTFQNLIHITPNATSPLKNVEVYIDLAKATTGFVATHTTQTIQFAVARKIDGTNWKRDIDSLTTARAANLSGLQGIKIPVGDIGPDEQARIEVVLSAENAADVEMPFVMYYEANGVNAPTISPVAAA